jgi:hypothetical protein
VPEHGVLESEYPLDLGNRRRLGGGLEEDVVALAAVLDLVGEGPAAPVVDTAGLATATLHEVEQSVDSLADVAFFEVDIENDHDFVRAH